ncbi:hypothetical protein [Streptomyces sp. H27-C3]|uniref:hypothetical protein n=1 Tax=Streptomyces sp. H27-C3 TaxID=3046305 RepID=UPI0024BA7C46|nr:hypothetical protein [Streptomyces sp. H27-C3]MDJ0466091.1 hypothetical protein [Streptomyces sp. H27-C3]
MATLSDARSVYGKGTPGPTCKRHNQIRKATAVAFELFGEFGTDLNLSLINRLTQADMAAAAARAGVNPPTTVDTRNAIKLLLRFYLTLGRLDLSGQNTMQVADQSLQEALAEVLGADRPTTAVNPLGLTVLLLPIDRQL